MSIIKDLPDLFRQAQMEYENLKAGDFKTIMTSGNGGGISHGQKVREETGDSLMIWADNRKSLPYLAESGYAGKIQMIYADPPFFSKNNYSAVVKVKDTEGITRNIKVHAYDDRWGNDISNYIREMIVQVLALKELLREDGVIVVHLDWHAVHYARIVLDEIFGADNFINEVIWSYKSGGGCSRRFSRKHDNLLIYGKTSGYKFRPVKEKSYNRGFKPYMFRGVEEFHDENGWYTMVNARDVWNIDAVGRTSSERIGYATQKPEKLLTKLIEAFTDEGDTVADFFSGSGTTAAAAVKSNRRWICADKNAMSVAMSLSRIAGYKGKYRMIMDAEIKNKKGVLDVWADDNSVRFLSYSHADEKNIDDKSTELINDIAAARPADLITYVSLDTDYDGKVHKNRYDTGGTFGSIPENIIYKGNRGKTLHILTADLLGCFSEREIKI